MSKGDFRRLVDYNLQSFRMPMDVESAGTRSGAIGAQLENIVAVSNAAYERLKLGLIKKNYVKTKHIPGGKVIYSGKQTVDYDGILQDVGFCAFDCKSTKEKHWRPRADEIHQFCYLLTGQRLIPSDRARFFYLLERRGIDDSRGYLRQTTTVYLVENLEALREDGFYEFRDEDIVKNGAGGILLDYRTKLLERVPEVQPSCLMNQW